MVVLNEGIRDAEVGEFRLVVGLDEETARVAMDDWTQLKHAWKGCLDSLHQPGFSLPGKTVAAGES
jgi:hypothetical protein